MRSTSAPPSTTAWRPHSFPGSPSYVATGRPPTQRSLSARPGSPQSTPSNARRPPPSVLKKHPLSALFRHGTVCNHQPPESHATVRPPHSGRSWHAAHPSRTTGLYSGRLAISSYQSPNLCLGTRPSHRSSEFPSRTTRQRSTRPCSTSPVNDTDSTVPWPSRRRATPPSASKS